MEGGGHKQVLCAEKFADRGMRDPHTGNFSIQSACIRCTFRGMPQNRTRMLYLLCPLEEIAETRNSIVLLSECHRVAHPLLLDTRSCFSLHFGTARAVPCNFFRELGEGWAFNAAASNVRPHRQIHSRFSAGTGVGSGIPPRFLFSLATSMK